MNIGSGITIGNGITVSDSINTSSSPFTTNLVLNLDAATYSGSGAWIDSVAGRSFTLFNSPTWSSSIGGGSFNFSSASQSFAQCSTSLTSMSNWTVEAWHYYDGTSVGINPCIVTESLTGASLTGTINYTLGTTTSVGLQSGFFDGLAWRTTPAHSLTAGNWYQIVGTSDGLTIKLYVNNSLVQSTNYTGSTTSSGIGIILMKKWAGAGAWGGRLGIVRIYNADIGSTAIAQNWNANKTRFGI